jgi:hypothetical protein
VTVTAVLLITLGREPGALRVSSQLGLRLHIRIGVHYAKADARHGLMSEQFGKLADQFLSIQVRHGPTTAAVSAVTGL